MKELPEELKLTYIITTAILMLFVVFIIVVVLLYNRKQLLYLKEKQLAEAEHQNQLLQKEVERQKSVLKERERISHDMHDDLGAGISAMKLQAEFLKKKFPEEALQQDFDDLLKTSEEMNISMREILWSLNSKNDTIENLIDYITIYAENFFRKTDIQVGFIKKEILFDKEISAEKRRNLFLCIKESLNNIYKHSKAENARIQFSLSDSIFTIAVSDDGIGIKPNEKSGNGLQNMKKRMTEVGGEVIIQKDEGTTLLLTVEL